MITLSNLLEGLRRSRDRLAELGNTPAGRTGDIFDAVRELPNETKVHELASALELLEEIDNRAGTTMLHLEHIEAERDVASVWVVAQTDGGDNRGGFNKMTKICDDKFYHRWADANAQLNSISPEIRGSYAVFPVVLVAGNEPRHTAPYGDLLV